MAYFDCIFSGGSSGGGYTLTVTCDAAFAGTTITCTDGVTTLTQTCPSSSPYEVVFEIPNGGEWTISGIISGQTYSVSIDIPDSLELHSVPEGSTVLPTDDIQTWLACAGITDKSYTTLNEVLADSTTLLALMSDNNAVDYLVRSTTWASGLTADSTAMTDIGANNYCANTLLSDSTWHEAIANSTYIDSVLNVKNPTMTGNTTPSGECSASSNFNQNNYPTWKAFDGNTGTNWLTTTVSASTVSYIQYKFSEARIINTVKMIFVNWASGSMATISNISIKGSNDGSNFTPLLSYQPDNDINQLAIFDNNDIYLYYRVEITGYNAINTAAGIQSNVSIAEMKFYGREDV